jgi:hypothetical protein
MYRYGLMCDYDVFYVSDRRTARNLARRARTGADDRVRICDPVDEGPHPDYCHSR